MVVHAWAAKGPGEKLERYEYDPGPLGAEEVEIEVENCGICHSDLSVIKNDWGISTFPAVPGHEVTGRVVALGSDAKGVTVGQHVGVGWNAGSCMHCQQCQSGYSNMCAENVATIVGHFGGFADRLRVQWPWAIPLPGGLDTAKAGPLLCGGTTVFAPFYEFDIKPTDRVGVVGIGGLGHLGLQFAEAWGCHVTAFTSTESKADEARDLGAHHVVNSRSKEEIGKVAGSLDLLLVTVNVPLDWQAMIGTIRPNGRMHLVGAVLKPIPVNAFDLILAQRSISGSPNAGPVVTAKMLEFAARHGIIPQTEHFPMSDVNEALAHLEAGKARYRIVLDA